MQITKDGKYKTRAGLKARILTTGLLGIKCVAYVTDSNEGELLEYVTSGGKYALGETTQKDLVVDDGPDFEIKVGPGYVCRGEPARVLANDLKGLFHVLVAVLREETEEVIWMTAAGKGRYGEKLELAVDWSKVPLNAPVWSGNSAGDSWTAEHFAGVHAGKTYVYPGQNSQHTFATTDISMLVYRPILSLTAK